MVRLTLKASGLMKKALPLTACLTLFQSSSWSDKRYHHPQRILASQIQRALNASISSARLQEISGIFLKYQ